MQRLHNEANIRERSSNWSLCEALLEHTSCLCIFNTFASCLLHRVNTL